MLRGVDAFQAVGAALLGRRGAAPKLAARLAAVLHCCCGCGLVRRGGRMRPLPAGSGDAGVLVQHKVGHQILRLQASRASQPCQVHCPVCPARSVIGSSLCRGRVEAHASARNNCQRGRSLHDPSQLDCRFRVMPTGPVQHLRECLTCLMLAREGLARSTSSSGAVWKTYRWLSCRSVRTVRRCRRSSVAMGSRMLRRASGEGRKRCSRCCAASRPA